MERWAKSKSSQRPSGRRQQAGELVLCIDNGRPRAGSTWSNSSGVNVGNLGTGTLTIAEGGIVTGPIVIATNASAIGTLNIGAGAGNPAAAPGTLTAPSLAFGAGTGMINFNHILRLRVCASNHRQRHCQCARGHHNIHRCQ